jgi:hypothetical protein
MIAAQIRSKFNKRGAKLNYIFYPNDLAALGKSWPPFH